MKNTLKTLLTLTLALVMCTSLFTACKKDDNEDSVRKITQEEIKNALSSHDGTLTIEGSADNVTAFTYVLSGVNTSKLVDKDYTRKAVNVLLTDSSKLTFAQLKVCNAFSATMSIANLLEDDDDESFDANTYTEDLLTVLCDGQSREYGSWTLSASIDEEADSITISARSK